MADLGTRVKDIAYEVANDIMKQWPAEIRRELAEKIEQRLRREMAGDRVYISNKSTASREQKYDMVRRMFNGRNATAIAHELKIGRTTVYRILKTAG